MKHPVIFFRNDDVRDSLDESLVIITGLFVKHKIPISHAVEPANVTQPVANWLLKVKKQYPDIIEIVQHGYDHSKKAVTASGEFGGTRTYEDQYNDIAESIKLMHRYFGKCWFKAFTFPYGTYNYETLRALKDLNYNVVSTGYTHSLKRYFLNTAGTLLKKKFLINKPIHYFNEKIPGLGMLELPTSINMTKRTLDENNSIQKTFEELKKEFELKKSAFHLIGFLIHHRWWKEDDFKAMDELLAYLKKGNYSFTTMERLND
jgi:peptidoglycan/xylan/chitin deacetylase (PgdA/CDA1 family)